MTRELCGKSAMSEFYVLSGPGNGANMCGSANVLGAWVPASVRCSSCGYKTDPFFVPTRFKLRNLRYDVFVHSAKTTKRSLPVKETASVANALSPSIRVWSMAMHENRGQFARCARRTARFGAMAARWSAETSHLTRRRHC